MKRTLLLCAAISISTVGSFPLHAQEQGEVQKVFDDLFGAELKRVLATSVTSDDLELAARLLESAATVVETPTLMAVICRNAAHVATKDPQGIPIARKALSLMHQHAPGEDTSRIHAAILDLYQTAYVRARSTERAEAGDAFIDALLEFAGHLESAGDIDSAIAQYRRADAIASATRSPRQADMDRRIKEVFGRKAVFARIQTLSERITANPGDSTAGNELVYLCLIELDNPEGALKHANRLTDETLRKNAERAIRPIDDLDEADALAVGLWYENLLERASSSRGKTAVLTRMVAAFDRYLTLHTNQDLDRLRVTVKHDRFAKELAALDKPKDAAQPAGGWIDLVALIDLNRDAISGEWARQGGQAAQVDAPKDAMLRIPVVPEGDYELAIQFTRMDGGYYVGYVLPLGDTSVCLYLGWSGKVDGLSVVNGRDVARNETTQPSSLTNGQKYTLAVRVNHLPGDEVQIAVALDGKALLNWKGARSALTPCRRLNTGDPVTFGVGSWRSRVQIHAAKLRMLTGKAKTLTDADLKRQK